MPELPEVETIRTGLLNLLPGKTIKAINFDWPKGFPNSPADVKAFLIGADVIDIRRRAKVLLIDLSTEYTLVIHLKMTGQLVYIGKAPNKPKSPKYAAADTVRFGAGHPNNSLVGDLPDRSTRVTFTFSDGSNLFFNDQRKFGWVKLMPTFDVANMPFMQKVGPEPLNLEFTQADFRKRLARRPNTNIKAALLDQSVIAGIGNIYADESLWGAKIHPTALVKNLSKAQTDLLLKEIRYVLNLSIEKGGSSDRNYVNAEGIRGSYLDFARVFRREGQLCPRCGDTIIKTRVAGRGTHTCPTCQPIPK